MIDEQNEINSIKQSLTTHIIAELKSSCKIVKGRIFNSDKAQMKDYEIVSEWKDEWEPHYKGYILDTVRLFDEEWNTHLYVIPRIAKDMSWNIRLSDDEEWEAVKKMREENEQIKVVKD